jgi:L-alanine-DL-glutamate epimerase-like enolase superfamily enzyme
MLANAIRFVKALEPYDLAWAEDLIPPTGVDAWAP